MKESDLTVFLDRDGVINRRIPDDYVTCWREFELLPGALDAICRLNRAGFRTVVVTNQRGVALGRMTMDDVKAVHQELSDLIGSAGGALREFYVCPHDRDSGCDCRKPLPGLLDQADAFRPVAWRSSYLVGDSDSDIIAGQARDVITLKIGEGAGVQADMTVANLGEAATRIIRRVGKGCVF